MRWRGFGEQAARPVNRGKKKRAKAKPSGRSERRKPIKMRARYEGYCRECKRKIKVGDEILYAPANERHKRALVVHPGCAREHGERQRGTPTRFPVVREVEGHRVAQTGPTSFDGYYMGDA